MSTKIITRESKAMHVSCWLIHTKSILSYSSAHVLIFVLISQDNMRNIVMLEWTTG